MYTPSEEFFFPCVTSTSAEIHHSISVNTLGIGDSRDPFPGFARVCRAFKLEASPAHPHILCDLFTIFISYQFLLPL